jgi:hypothetical protein
VGLYAVNMMPSATYPIMRDACCIGVGQTRLITSLHLLPLVQKIYAQRGGVGLSPGGVVLGIYIRSYPDAGSKRALIITVHKGYKTYPIGRGFCAAYKKGTILEDSLLCGICPVMSQSSTVRISVGARCF